MMMVQSGKKPRNQSAFNESDGGGSRATPLSAPSGVFECSHAWVCTFFWMYTLRGMYTLRHVYIPLSVYIPLKLVSGKHTLFLSLSYTPPPPPAALFSVAPLRLLICCSANTRPSEHKQPASHKHPPSMWACVSQCMYRKDTPTTGPQHTHSHTHCGHSIDWIGGCRKRRGWVLFPGSPCAVLQGQFTALRHNVGNGGM